MLLTTKKVKRLLNAGMSKTEAIQLQQKEEQEAKATRLLNEADDHADYIYSYLPGEQPKIIGGNK